MDFEDILPKAPGDPLAMLVRQDLDRLSLAELDERVTILEAEIARVRAKRSAGVNHRASAESIFKR